MSTKFKRYSLCLDDKTYDLIKTISKNTGNSIAYVSRELIKKGLAKDYVDDSKDIISDLIRDQLEIVLKPSVERLAALESKSGHMAATAAFLNVQALMDLVPTERRKNVRQMYDNARKKAAYYMKTKTCD